MVDPAPLRAQLAQRAPQLWGSLSALAARWLAPALQRLNVQRNEGHPKTFNDPVWGVIELLPWETILLDSPLLQRLRGVRQLGLSHLVYPSANHDRLEHSRGVVEAAERMIQALERNAEHRRRFGRDRDAAVPSVSEEDRVATRLAALLHDTGHGPFSHASEYALSRRLSHDFDEADAILRERFDDISGAAPGEILSVLLVLSPAMAEVMCHPRFKASKEPELLPGRIIARILGSRHGLDAGYLSNIVSGPIDADKLDYMSRDSHHAGLPLGQDVGRLISKLEVLVVSPETAPTPELRRRAQAAPGQRLYEIGLSLSGVGAYEQMVVGRVMLYDRIYYHHKVRAAEAMVRRLIDVAEQERHRLFTLEELFAEHADDAVLHLLGGIYTSAHFSPGGPRAAALAQQLVGRDMYYRAYAFSHRFLAGLEGLPERQRQEIRAMAWRKVVAVLADEQKTHAIEAEILKKAHQLAATIPELGTQGHLGSEHVLLDLPLNKVAAKGSEILTRTEGGYIGSADLFFDPSRWSQAYEERKQCGFVFTPAAYVPLVALASRIVFYEVFGIVMGEQAHRASKTTEDVPYRYIEAAQQAGLCTAETLLALAPVVRLVPFLPAPLGVPEQVAEVLDEVIPEGLPEFFYRQVVDGVEKLAELLASGGLGWNAHPDTEAFQNYVQSWLNAKKEGNILRLGGLGIVAHLDEVAPWPILPNAPDLCTRVIAFIRPQEREEEVLVPLSAVVEGHQVRIVCIVPRLLLSPAKVGR